jgi:hypothetical protein
MAFAQAQKVSLPTKGSSVSYDATVKVDGVAKDYICGQLKSWAAASAKDAKIMVDQMSEEGCTIVLKGRTNIEEKGNFSDVFCSFVLVVGIKDGIYSYELTDLNFNKGQQAYSVNEVYQAYLKNDPMVKQTFETKQSALRRHEFLLNAVNERINLLLTNMKNYVLGTDARR